MEIALAIIFGTLSGLLLFFCVLVGVSALFDALVGDRR